MRCGAAGVALMTRPAIEAIVRARHLVEQIAALRYLDALYGDRPEVPFALADPTEPRFRVLRALPGMGTRARGDPLAQIWLRDHRRCILFHTLVRSSAWMNGTAASLSVAELARLSGLSVQSVQLALRDARLVGDLVSVRAEHDRRRLEFAPSPELRTLADARRRHYVDVACQLTGRPDPTPRLSAEGVRAWRRLYAEICVNKTGRSAARGRRLTLAGRALLVWDLVADGPQPTTRFMPRQQERAQVSRQTIPNHLAWLRAEGWLCPGEPLTPTPLARERFSLMLGVFEACAQRVLDLLDLLAEQPGVAACILLPPGGATCPRSWVRCRRTVSSASLPSPATPGRREAGLALCAVPDCPLLPPAGHAAGAAGARRAGVLVGARGIEPLTPTVSR